MLVRVLNRNSQSLQVGCKMVEPLWKIVWHFLIKVNILLSYDPAITLLAIYSPHRKKLKTFVHTEICMPMFMAALFTTVKTWEEPRCPSVGERVNKLLHVQTIEYYSEIKRNRLPSHEKTWRKLTRILLSEEANLKRLHAVWFQLHNILEKAKLGRL